MGSDPAPFMANLFLYYFENKWVNNLKKQSLGRARKFNHTFRFIDDLFTINDGGEFSEHYHEIYPPELQLNLEHSGDNVNFLDINIVLSNGNLTYKLYDKRNDFAFNIVRLPFLKSNIPSTMFYSSVAAEILRIGRVSSSLENFLAAVKTLISRMHKQGARTDRMTKVLQRTYGRQEILKQFGVNAKHFVEQILY